MGYRGRFAPSPTGDLHFGSAATALLAWLRARAANGAFLWRVEDIDTPRIVAGCEQQQRDDLHWLGLDWDEGPDIDGAHAPYRQSQRGPMYEEALARLAAQGLLYLCDCSRKEIAGVASAPHAGEEGPRYAGTCRRHGMRQRHWRRPPAVRLAVPDREIVVDDLLQGQLRQNVAAEVGDFILKRGDGIYAYQLAVVVDDLAMEISEVVRGVDLLTSAPRQKLMAELLGGRAPDFAHVPLVVGHDGSRLQKRNTAQTLRGQRAQGSTAAQLLRTIARTLGLQVPDRTDLRLQHFLDGFDISMLRGCREVRLHVEPR
ncbi:MAG: tRNA glutamyl-Q(34) synthetase GluQRS [Deltaproteobacteria bacterium]|nr:tRNA glutamyl-Q(34) synthetase GluQRS [Deltaproteobacteria bacterium]